LQVKVSKTLLVLLFWSLTTIPFVANANQEERPVIAVTDTAPLTTQPTSAGQLLPDRLGGFRASSELKQFGADSLGELVANPDAYREYLLLGAASREYGSLRVDVYHVENSFAAFGLYTYGAGAAGTKASRSVGSDSAATPEGFIFWRDNFVIRISDSNKQRTSPGTVSLAGEIAKTLGPEGEINRPVLLDSLPDNALDNSRRYFLGPTSLSASIKQGGEMFQFAGRAEAVLAEYNESTQTQDVEAGPESAAGSQITPLKLVIVEYHTPNFATDAFARANDYVSSLPQEAQNQILVKREGNYIVSAIGFSNRDFAEQLIGSVKYPYTVKWLRNPLWPTNDPWRTQKAAQMLLSTFGILGLMVLSVLIVGGTVGTVVFLKRRKRQREIFSDAGGMLRLDLDPFDATILGLPPGKE
jgi:hypothetical protein